MGKTERSYDFNGGWSPGEANHHTGKKNSVRTHSPKNQYTRKVKHKNKEVAFKK